MRADLFFPKRGAGRGEGTDVAQAKAVCGACPVRSDCLDYSFENNERAGIWGGLSEKQRRTVRARNRAGRGMDAGPKAA